MEESSGSSHMKNLLVLSVAMNIMLAFSMGYLLWHSNRLENQINDFSSSHTELAESARNLEQRLNVTMTQLDYYKKIAEYYSSLSISDNAQAGFVGHATIPIVALQTVQNGFKIDYEGVVMYADIELSEGSGRILIGTMPKIGIDIQTSVRTAVLAAETLTGISFSKTDVLLTVRASQDVDVVDGQSAGAAITVALVSALTNRSLNEGVYMTGTINSDLSVGAVGGIPYKSLAVAENGSKYFIVPKGQSTVVVYEPRTRELFPGRTITTYEMKTMGLEEYLSNQGYSVIVEEVETIEEALTKFFT